MRADAKDIVGGGVITLVGTYALYLSMGYRTGTAQQMGPGYFPMVVSGILICLGLLIMLLALTRSGRLPTVEWRPMVAILASVLAFALTIAKLGFIPAVFATVIVSALGDRHWRPATTLALAAGLSLVTWILFVKLLGMTIPALVWPILIE